MAKLRDRLFIDKDDKASYEHLKEESMFADKDNKDVFIMAMVYGYSRKESTAIDRKHGYVRTSYLNDEDWALLRAIALAEESAEVLADSEKVCQLCEQYANAGIKLLYGKIIKGSFGSFEKEFEKELSKIHARVVGDKS